MKVTFLGTGTSQGVPLIGCGCSVCSSNDEHDKRLRCSIHLEVNGKSFVIDSGPDFRQQMLSAGIKRLDALLFTHPHKDHTAGFDDIRAFNFIQQEKINVYANALVQKSLRQEFSYIFSDFKYPGIPEINLIDIDKAKFTAAGVEFQPIEVIHFKLPVLGFRVHDFTYITDANYISPEEKEKIKGSDVIVLNALRREKHISHFNLEEALALMEELKPRMGYLTHISHQLGLHEEIQRELPDNVRLAHDGLVLDLS